MNKVQLFFEALKNIKTVGTVTFSSKHLVKKLIGPIDFSTAKIIIELGAGNGCITKGLLEKMRPDAILLAFEINPSFCEMLREINDPRLKVIEDSAEFMEKYLEEQGSKYADYIVSALPMVMLPKELSTTIIHLIKKVLKPGSLYLQISYSKLRFKRFVNIFDHTKTKYVIRNVPPAFVFICTKAAKPVAAGSINS